MAWDWPGRELVLAFAAGAAATLVLVMTVTASVLRASGMYSLGHWKLNARTPLGPMWMNLGYWKSPTGQVVRYFDEACLGLLREMLETAEIIRGREGAVDRPGEPQCSPNSGISFLDLGFGCGDQTWELSRLIDGPSRQAFRYVGLTLNQMQHRMASRKIQQELAAVGPGRGLDQASFRLFCADAAKPRAWPDEIRKAVESLAEAQYTQRWLLALDCLYHFSPSRRLVLEYAARKLHASVLAFDLILNEEASYWEVTMLKAIGWIMGCPPHAFLTEDQYKNQLVDCGYERGLVVIRDISADVFPGVVSYLQRQEEALGEYGISLGGFKLAARIFRWFDRSRVVKAVIVVAHAKKKPD